MPYRSTNFRKQDQRDFSNRVKRIDPAYFRLGQQAYAKDTTREHVFGAAVIGFAWAYLVAAISTNRSVLEDSLRQSILSTDAQYWVISSLAALLAASMVMIALHVVRFLATKGARRKNSRSLLIGAMMAFALFYTPEVVWQTGYGMLDGHSQDFLASAGDMVEQTFPRLSIDNIAFTSSGGS
ncbi:hypothetical protein [Antarctobacter jejuensis]|uniref:hypothetical protein n=1 Tax=Antarctobacter jejuensis TaxID=1439938 RepID=UPI003FD53C0B